MNFISRKAYAKINLTLNIIGKRDDGYHNLKSVCQITDFYDDISVEKISGDNIELFCSLESLNNTNNIVYKAYFELKSLFSNISGVKVSITKRIPIEAGLGGGSADCGAFLIIMNELFSLGLSDNDLISIGVKLGADVPLCMQKGLVLVGGKGEKIIKIQEKIDNYLLIIKPKISFSTREMFNYYQLIGNDILQLDNTETILSSIGEKDLIGLSKNLYNVFESLIPKDSEIFDIKKALISEGSIGALMSGSGSSVFGIFDDFKKAEKAYYNLKDKYEIYLTKPIYE